METKQLNKELTEFIKSNDLDNQKRISYKQVALKLMEELLIAKQSANIESETFMWCLKCGSNITECNGEYYCSNKECESEFDVILASEYTDWNDFVKHYSNSITAEKPN